MNSIVEMGTTPTGMESSAMGGEHLLPRGHTAGKGLEYSRFVASKGKGYRPQSWESQMQREVRDFMSGFDILRGQLGESLKVGTLSQAPANEGQGVRGLIGKG